jgi:hypothetical protein
MDVLLAQPADVAAIWRPLSDDEVVRVAHLIHLASAKLRAAVSFDLSARVDLFAVSPSDPLALDPVLVAGVVAAMVKRVLVNPDGLQSSTRTVGPYSESRTHGAQGEGSGEVQVTAADLAALAPRVVRSPVRTLQTGLSDRMLPDRWPHRWLPTP